jgi:hypothetical protein
MILPRFIRLIIFAFRQLIEDVRGRFAAWLAGGHGIFSGGKGAA